MDQNIKQQAVETIKQAVNILVTVSANPSVDQLSAALGLTLMLGKLNKHATAVFSGEIPQAIKFLEPGKTFEDNVDSLRDFIIALDKDKADKLRYKVEDNVVRIFITPYKTKITKDDFEFTQGDFNVDAVVALGVSDREELDAAIKSHGRILHDASVVTINAGGTQSKLGAINWSDDSASSLCEMLVSVSESFGSGLLDQQISTAFLTGIVAATNRFSNDKTSPKVMTMSAQLMAAGASQQLIAKELNIKETPPPPPAQVPESKPVVPEIEQGQEIDLGKDRVVEPVPVMNKPAEILPPSEDESLKKLEGEIAALGGGGKTEDLPSPDIPLPEVKPVTGESTSDENHPMISKVKGQGPQFVTDEKPEMGGTFSATATQAHDDVESQRLNELNGSILQHGDKASDDAASPTVHADPIQPLLVPPKNPAPPEQTAPTEPAGDISGQVDLNAARQAVDSAVASQPFDPANNPVESMGSQPLPEQDANQQIRIDENGMVTTPGAEGQATDNEQPPIIL